ncbi:MAG: MarR family transcriptional regulator [Xanthobacteraceae bacterium]
MPKSSSDRNDRESRFAALDAALREASGLGVVLSQAVAEHLGISPKDLECLDILYLRGPATAGELAQATGLTTGAITGLIDRLEAAGFARRERALQDRRKVLVRALPSVDSEIMPLYASLQARMQDLMAQMSNDDIDRLLAFLRAAREIMLSEIAAFRSSLAKTKQG